MSVFIDLLDAIDCGKKVHINLVEKTVKINGSEINLEGKELIESKDMDMMFATEPWKIAEELYARYKRSIPSITTKTNKPYFHADSVEDLTDNEIAFNAPRDWCQVCLEGYILIAGLSGWLELENEKYWFWQSKKFKEFVILKEWIQ